MAIKRKMPPLERFEEAIRIADNVEIFKWHPEYIRLSYLNETEYKDPSDELIRLMDRTPGKVPPIVVYPSRAPLEFDIIDGHHRFRAAQELGLKGLWAVVIDEGRYA